MRVLHVVPSLAACDGGPAAAALAMTRALSREGVDCLLAATDADGRDHLPVRAGEEADFEGVRTVFFRHVGRLASFKWSPALARWLHGNVSRFDVVHAHAVFSHAPVAAGAACRRSGTPLVVRPLGHLDAWSLSQGRTRKRFFLAAVGRRLLTGARAVHWTTEAERDGAAKVARGLPGFVVPLGVEERLFEEGDAGEGFRTAFPAVGTSPYVLFLSRLDPKKNVEGLIEAFISVREKAEGDWKLVVAGDGDSTYAASLRSLAKAPGGAGSVLFAGWLSGAVKASALWGAALFALPSHQENFGIAVGEAMAAGCPVLVSDRVNLASQIVEAGAGWVVGLEADAVGTGLREAFGSAEQRAQRGSMGRSLAKARFRWDVVARQLIVRYQEILAAPGRATW